LASRRRSTSSLPSAWIFRRSSRTMRETRKVRKSRKRSRKKSKNLQGRLERSPPNMKRGEGPSRKSLRMKSLRS